MPNVTQESNTKPEKLHIGTKVTGPHGEGTIIAYNDSKSHFYNSTRFPYVVLFECGFADVYSKVDLDPLNRPKCLNPLCPKKPNPAVQHHVIEQNAKKTN